MYKFTDTNQIGVKDAAPNDAIYLHKESKTIDDFINGFSTVNVEGRGVPNVDYSTAETSGSGAVLLDSSFKEREMTLNGFLKCETSDELNKKVDKLNALFSDGPLEFSFADEEDFVFNGSFSIDNIQAGSVNPEVTVKINLFDPFKYTKETYTLNKGEVFVARENAVRDANGGFRPQRINFDGDMSNGLTFTVSSKDKRRNGKCIKLTKYSGNHSGYIDFSEGGQLYIGGALSDAYLDVSSDIYGFVLGEGDKIETNATTCSAEFKFKGV